MAWHVMEAYESHTTARANFEWNLPASYNPARDLLAKHPNPDQIALTALEVDSTDDRSYSTREMTFGELDEYSDRLAQALADRGIEGGDRVAVIVAQRPANPLTHLANWKLGAVSVPLTVLFGRDALGYRLRDSGARAVVADGSVIDDVAAIRADCPDLEFVVGVGEKRADADNREAVTPFEALLHSSDGDVDPYPATPETPTAIMYTSGSTGRPKGVLHGHALWLGRAGAAFNYFDQGLGPDATVWTPADWAWGAALGGTLFAAWHFGACVVAWPRNEFDPHAIFSHLERHEITHAFMPPTALRLLMAVDEPAEQYDLAIETIAAAGEPLTPEILAWVDQAFDDLACNEFYGQTELNLCVGNCSAWFSPKPGHMGKPLPGYDVAILDPDSHEPLDTGETGEIAVRPHDRRVFFQEYWNQPAATEAKQTEDGWFLTGDLATRDEDGYLKFVARSDDVILSRGYRIGPTAIEKALLDHPAVAQAGVVGVPHEVYGEAILAAVETRQDEAGSPPPAEGMDLADELRERVRKACGEHASPDRIEFVDELPTTTTGKIRRKSIREQFRPDGA